MSEPVIFEKEMGITHRDFVRLLARAVGHNDFSLRNGKISVVDGARTFVRFALTGYPDAAQEMARIDLHFQRGGG